jgi:hypothetical protein
MAPRLTAFRRCPLIAPFPGEQDGDCG